MSQPLRVAIIGAGGIANVHSQGWLAYPEQATIAAYVDIDTDRAQYMSNLYTGGAAKTIGSLDDLLTNEDVDVIDVCLPHHLHTDAVIKGAEAGKAVLCEKPLCNSLADARRIRATLEKSGTVFMSGHNNLFAPALLEARRLIATGVIGKPLLYKSIETFQSLRFDPFAYGEPVIGGGQGGWRGNVAHSGGGELLDTGYHSTYRLLALANNARPVEVTGFLSRFLNKRLPMEDTGQVMVRFEDGAMGEILTSWAIDVEGRRQFEVSGDQGMLSGTATRLSHSLYGWSDPAQREFANVPTFTAEIGHFIKIVQQGASNPANIDVAIRTLQVIKGAYLSAKLGQTVTLPEDPAGDPVPGAASATEASVDVLEGVV